MATGPAKVLPAVPGFTVRLLLPVGPANATGPLPAIRVVMLLLKKPLQKTKPSPPRSSAATPLPAPGEMEAPKEDDWRISSVPLPSPRVAPGVMVTTLLLVELTRRALIVLLAPTSSFAPWSRTVSPGPARAMLLT